MKEVYDKIFSNYQFGWANPKLESFSSINTSLKITRKIFSKSNKAIASKELFENLTNDQKKDLKSFYKLRFEKLIKDKTIVNLNRMPELKSIARNLRLIFFEDEDFNVQGQVLFKDKPSTIMWGRAIKETKTSILVIFLTKLTFLDTIYAYTGRDSGDYEEGPAKNCSLWRSTGI